MKQIKFLFVLFILLQYPAKVYPQEISFYYDEISDSLFSQSNSDQLIENLTKQLWVESSSSWVNDSLLEYSYNNQNLLDTFITHKWRYGTTWGNDLRSVYTYNSNDKLILISSSEWAGASWYENSRHQYNYAGPSQNLSRINFYWLLQTWGLTGYRTYSWNTNNYLINVTSYTLFNQVPWTYYAYWKDEYYYDSTNVLIRKTGFQSYYGYNWTNDINDLYFYDQNGNNNERIRQNWNSTDSIWVNDYRYLYEYDLNNVLLSIVYQDWQQDSLAWENVWRETYTYTPQNEIATMLKETWSTETSWKNNVLRNYFYDTNYNWVERITYLWNETSWENYYRHLATWQEPVSVEVEIPISNSFYLFNNYPNPFNPSTKIKFKVPQSPLLGGDRRGGLVTLKVYDILGNEITTLVNEEKPAGEYEIEFDGSELPSGIYFYTLKAGSYLEAKKMILLK